MTDDYVPLVGRRRMTTKRPSEVIVERGRREVVFEIGVEVGE